MSTVKTQHVLHKAGTRGRADHGWLLSHHTFSFARYYDPERVHFGALRVLNDDIVQAGRGFGEHPHDNMEIISIPLSGSLAHKDSTGNTREIKQGEVQIMTAGTGLTHSEFNYSKTDPVNFLQIWILPKNKNISPRYDQKRFDLLKNKNKFVTVVSPTDDDALWINQDAYLSLGVFDAGQHVRYTPHKADNGVYAFVLDGEAEIDGQPLQQRDGLGLVDVDTIDVKTHTDLHLLLIEVPML